MKRLLLAFACMISTAGCLYSDPAGTEPPLEKNKEEPAASSSTSTESASSPAPTPDTPAAAAPAAESAAAPMPEPAPAETIQKKAAVGATGKGNYGDGAGFVTTPISTYFHVKERAVYDIQIPHAMNLYRASNETFPKSHDEFMEVIIKANNIQLPQLPPGHKYVYDPETHTLMVEQPK